MDYSEETRILISRYRTELMGFAIISIMIGHLHFFQLFDFGDLSFFASLGSAGVEIFLFVSGFGLFYSFEKSNNLPQYFKRRFLRIVPTYVFIMAGIDILTCNITALYHPSYWIMHLLSYWYIPFICIMYIVFPMLYYIQKKSVYLPIFITLVITLILTYVLYTLGKGDIHNVPMLMAQRCPIFTVGMLVADRRVKLTLKHPYIWTCLCLAMIYCVYWLLHIDYAKYLIYLPLSYGLIIVLCRRFNKVLNTHIFRVFGKYSLEIYLIHMFLMPEMRNYNINPYLTIIIILIVSLLVAYIINLLIASMLSRMQLKQNNPKQ